MIELSYSVVGMCMAFGLVLAFTLLFIALMLKAEKLKTETLTNRLNLVASELIQVRIRYKEDHEFLNQTKMKMELANISMRNYKRMYEDSAKA